MAGFWQWLGRKFGRIAGKRTTRRSSQKTFAPTTSVTGVRIVRTESGRQSPLEGGAPKVRCGSCQKEIRWASVYRGEIKAADGVWEGLYCDHCGSALCAMCGGVDPKLQRWGSDWAWYPPHDRVNTNPPDPPFRLEEWGRRVPLSLVPFERGYAIDLSAIARQEQAESRRRETANESTYSELSHRAHRAFKDGKLLEAADLAESALHEGLPAREGAMIFGVLGENVLLFRQPSDPATARTWLTRCIALDADVFWKAHYLMACLYKIEGNDAKGNVELTLARRYCGGQWVTEDYKRLVVASLGTRAVLAD